MNHLYNRCMSQRSKQLINQQMNPLSDPCDVTPVAPTRCQVPSPAIYRGPCHNNRPVTSKPALNLGDHTPVPAKLGTPVEESLL